MCGFFSIFEKSSIIMKKESKLKVRSIIPYGGWKRALNAARLTAGKKPLDKEPSDKWKAKMLLAEHSPIRLVEYDGIWDFIKMYVTTHLVRHHEGVEKFVTTQRVDRNPELAGMDRDELPQGLENTMMISANAQAIINISRKRLCSCASAETREAWKAMLEEIRKYDPVLVDKCVPECVYRGFCPEFDRCCGYAKTEAFLEKLKDYRDIEKYEFKRFKTMNDIVDGATVVKMTPEEMEKFEKDQYKNGWKDLGNGLKMDEQGHIAGGLKISPWDMVRK